MIDKVTIECMVSGKIHCLPISAAHGDFGILVNFSFSLLIIVVRCCLAGLRIAFQNGSIGNCL